jgi:hypothetical protein
MSAPSAERIAELAPFWESVSVHEIGHAVVGARLGVPVHHVHLDYQRVSLLRWEVSGWTAIGPGGQGADVEADVEVLFTLAGLEAEAMWISTTHGSSLHRARAQVEGRKANRGDVDDITTCLPESGYTFDQATGWVHDTLTAYWNTVTYLAAALREQRYVSGADVARLI